MKDGPTSTLEAKPNSVERGMGETTGLVPPPPAILLQMMTGYWVSQAIYVAAKLGVADLLGDGPRPVEELAMATQTDAPSLRRLLRALASVGVFTEASPGAFTLTPMGHRRELKDQAETET